MLKLIKRLVFKYFIIILFISIFKFPSSHISTRSYIHKQIKSQIRLADHQKF